MKKYIVLILISILPFGSLMAQKSKIIAHRGAFKKNNLPENSIASLKEAIRLKCWGTEFDIHLTSDGVAVINHDAEFKGIKIEASTFADLQKAALANGEKIPTLRAYLDEGGKQNKTKLILEIKPSVVSRSRTLELTDMCVGMVKELGLQNKVEYISFEYDACKRVKELDPNAKVAYLKGDADPVKLKKDGLSGADYHYSVFQKNPGWIKELKALGLTSNAWTVNERKDMEWLIAEKVDYITTNEPELLAEVLKEKKKK